ncbi:MAG TPA: FAD/NAD(P)-binding oxidoreductase [Thermoflexales bacterium]|nr:FAD/NAD(P)-binding oxidoreductase [Thermoflexales bacterium]HQW35593.1 FAD/NAD(P)-binding oxidoreductase [Thermoflexales bacterium]HQZ22190.1 FAD/NAD(P)-binding oxidoreductase [Thermoflexales bacterium]HQZ98611.1 FAD/NAD(P)-binding oxidoreductase [Thermoflexales bacterium]
MKKLVVLGAGTAGTMVVNKLSHLLDFGDGVSEWKVTIVDQNPTHYYQPGFLFLPFGVYGKKDVIKPKRDFMPNGVELVMATIEGIDPEAKKVTLKGGRVLEYDFLIIATGADIHPEQTPGLTDGEWGKSIHTFYSFDGAVALGEKLRNWEGGRMVVNVVENPIKCPVAPLEFLMLADWYFHERGIREKVELVYATPLPGAFTKPMASQKLGHLLEEKNIKVETEFMIERAEPDARKIVSYDEREVNYDLLVSIPLNMGAPVVGQAGLGDELNFVPVDKTTFLSTKYPNIFALGDASNAPASKAGSVAHFAVDGFAENFKRYAEGMQLKPAFDGHANCFIESGFGKGLLIDFNYTTEPLPGRYPMPGVGPFTLLEESEANHWGKLMFKWMYWNLLLKGVELPLPALMSMAGKWAKN